MWVCRCWEGARGKPSSLRASGWARAPCSCPPPAFLATTLPSHLSHPVLTPLTPPLHEPPPPQSYSFLAHLSLLPPRLPPSLTSRPPLSPSLLHPNLPPSPSPSGQGRVPRGGLLRRPDRIARLPPEVQDMRVPPQGEQSGGRGGRGWEGAGGKSRACGGRRRETAEVGSANVRVAGGLHS